MFDPVSTYRVQFHAGFTFSDLEGIIPYLQRLGITTIYASPIFKAVPGSTHGYDGLHPHEINPELGTIEQLREVRQRLTENGMFWLQDVVPNHMAFHPGNEWLMDVLEKGPESPYASMFDIDWDNPVYEGRVMVPFLGDSLANAIGRGEVQAAYVADRLALSYYGNVYPLRPLSYPALFGKIAGPAAVQELMKEIPVRDEVADAGSFARRWNEWRRRFADLQRKEEVSEWTAACLKTVNNDTAQLQQIADEQHYRLCHWQETDKAINYRRFFTVNGLICLNVHEQHVFDRYHQLIRSLLDEEVFQGLRIDHVDGLYNPGEYLQRLSSLAGSESYIVVEKILAPDETLPAQWPVQGATGYEFLALVNNLLSERKSERLFTKYYQALTNDHTPVSQQILDKKAHILYQHMGGELENLVHLFFDLELIDAEASAVPREMLKKAIGEFLVHCPVYRFYGDKLPFSKPEATAVQSIFDSVKRANPEVTEAVGLLESAWLPKVPINDDYASRAAHFYKRCMQFSGPLMAKGVEDTLMYTFNRFITHNEVGDAPEAFGTPLKTFHEKMQDRQKHWPGSLNATSTHDTKRGEDVRARLNVLTDLPAAWFQTVDEWRALNNALKNENAPDDNDEYFIYQTLIGTYPMPGTDDGDYATRLEEYLQKALREGKRRSDWSTPNQAYEEAARQFARALLDRKKPFWKSFRKLHQTVADHGVVNSMVQLVLKFTCPGVPDTYQGTEGWDLSFVDPDNRRPVPFGKLEPSLASLLEEDKRPGFFKALWRNRFDGRIKLWLTHALLQMRKDMPGFFSASDYVPLAVEGEYKGNVLAFARRQRETWMVVAVPLHSAAMCKEQEKPILRLQWKDTRIVLPRLNGRWKNVLSGTRGEVAEALPVQELFQGLPVAILHVQAKKNTRGAGVLLHLTSLASRFGIGDMGPEAYSFADFLAASGQKHWQLLPVNPVEAGQGYSPYSALSSRAGNTWMISPELLAKDGLLSAEELPRYFLPHNSTADYAGAERVRNELFEQAWTTFNAKPASGLHRRFSEFCQKESDWLHDFALYTVLKESQQGSPWYDWDDKYKQRHRETMEAFGAEHAGKIGKAKWLQFIFDRQWRTLKAYCNARDIGLIGDLPFYVSYDSSDVWSHQEIFALDGKGAKLSVAGVPPDAFSEDGQLWGMPVFRWDRLKESGYHWWVERLRKNNEMFDLVRLDHFRAFSAYWDVPADAQTARHGAWRPGPGSGFFQTIIKELGGLPYLAEDLGEIDEPVYKLRDTFRLPGMKILQFAFGDDFPYSDYLPHNYTHRFFVYTGTHDNNTVRGWYTQEASEEARMHLARYAGAVTQDNVHLALARIAYASVAETVILPMQDVLGLDEKARMNTPASANGNWLWRLVPDQLDEDASAQLREWVHVYRRGY